MPQHPLRLQYEAAVAALGQAAAQRLAGGATEEQVARWAVEERNRIKQHFRERTTPEVLAAIEARTQARYGHPLGPAPDVLRASGKSWADIIESACRAGPGPGEWM